MYKTSCFYVFMQKLEQILTLLKPGSHCQKDVKLIEAAIYEACAEAVLEESLLGQVLKGPHATSEANHQLPAALPLWQRMQLEKMKSLKLSNQRRLTTDCLQAGFVAILVGRMTCVLFKTGGFLLDTHQRC